MSQNLTKLGTWDSMDYGSKLNDTPWNRVGDDDIT
jgi:hypothetical protein